MTRGRPVRIGEIGERPHRVALDFVARREREEVERPLVTVDHLRGFARPDVDDLGEVQLVARRVVTEDAVEHREHERVRGELAKCGRARDQRAGAARVAARELVAARVGRPYVRVELGVDLPRDALRAPAVR